MGSVRSGQKCTFEVIGVFPDALTYRSNGFITMLAPLRDHLHPKDPMSSPLLCATKERYFARMSVKHNLNLSGFEGSRWIRSEDVNVEHLLDVFTSINSDSDDIWSVCMQFMEQLRWHKPRQTVLRKKIEQLPDDHRLKPECLYELAFLHGRIGNDAEKVSLLDCALNLQRERGNNYGVAFTLTELSDANRVLGNYKEGIDQAREALDIYEWLGATAECAGCLSHLARLLTGDGQLDAAEEAALGSIELLPEKGQEHGLYFAHIVLGEVYQAKGETEKAIYHHELALGIASASNWGPFLFSAHLILAGHFLDKAGFDEAQVHIKQAKSHAHDVPHSLGAAVLLQAMIWRAQRRFKDALSEVIHAQEIYKKLGNLGFLEQACSFQRIIEEEMKHLPPSGETDSNGELSGTIACLTSVNTPLLVHGVQSSSSANTLDDPGHASKRSPHS